MCRHERHGRVIAGGALLLCLFASSRAVANNDGEKSCIAEWTASCSKDCTTAKCVSECTTQAHDHCVKDIAAPQNTFKGPVTATPTTCDAPPVAACSAPIVVTADGTVATVAQNCSTVTGTVANKALWGGQVTIYVVCPAGTPVGQPNETATTSVIGQTSSSCSDGSFILTATNSCSGQTGCYGVIAATPPTSCEACGTCGAATPAAGDPNWSTCTDGCCPAP